MIMTATPTTATETALGQHSNPPPALAWGDLRTVFAEAAERARETCEDYYRWGSRLGSLGTVAPAGEDLQADRARALLRLATRLADSAATRLAPGRDPERLAPISWAVHEIVEYVAHAHSLLMTGVADVFAPLTWWPSTAQSGAAALDLPSVVDERTRLLVAELASYGVAVRESDTAR